VSDIRIRGCIVSYIVYSQGNMDLNACSEYYIPKCLWISTLFLTVQLSVRELAE